MANTSPKKESRAPGTIVEFTNPPEPVDSPAARSAARLAGITPALAASAATLRTVPPATSRMPGMCRLPSRYQHPSA
ncbi:MAG TPA: hypothetical protein VGO92_04495 [Acidimicrobiales bacterium]|jgi:hypothetical protein|nr:hypothetical protein [Acidimicrobiales bacterium]